MNMPVEYNPYLLILVLMIAAIGFAVGPLVLALCLLVLQGLEPQNQDSAWLALLKWLPLALHLVSAALLPLECCQRFLAYNN